MFAQILKPIPLTNVKLLCVLLIVVQYSILISKPWPAYHFDVIRCSLLTILFISELDQIPLHDES